VVRRVASSSSTGNEPRASRHLLRTIFSEGGFETDSRGSLRGDAFAGAYLPIVERRRALPWGERERRFQAYRRGRYVEFNPRWDRGTLFGLAVRRSHQAILMSMPPLAAWRYQWAPEDGTPEAALYADFLRRAIGSHPERRCELWPVRGSFDPPHAAHRVLASAALEQLGLDELVWAPAGRRAEDRPRLAAAADRLEMLRLLVAGEPRFRVDERELHRAGPATPSRRCASCRAERPDTRWGSSSARISTTLRHLARLARDRRPRRHRRRARDGRAVRAPHGLAGCPHELRILEMPALPSRPPPCRYAAAGWTSRRWSARQWRAICPTPPLPGRPATA